MRVTDRLIEDAKKKQKQKRKREEWEEEEETYRYAHRKRIRDQNREPGVFGSGMGEGINTSKSVFDEMAVFWMDEE